MYGGSFLHKILYVHNLYVLVTKERYPARGLGLFMAVTRPCRVTALNSSPIARIHGLYRKVRVQPPGVR